MYIDGKKQEMDEDIFDQMLQALNPETSQCSCVCVCQADWAKEDMNVIIPPHPIPMFLCWRVPSRLS